MDESGPTRDDVIHAPFVFRINDGVLRPIKGIVHQALEANALIRKDNPVPPDFLVSAIHSVKRTIAPKQKNRPVVGNPSASQDVIGGGRLTIEIARRKTKKNGEQDQR